MIRYRGPLVSLVVVAIMLALAFAVDRRLLRIYGNPLWQYDSVLHYRHVPNARFEWGDRYRNKPIRINRHGHHDDDFPLRKPVGEFRLLVVGDSVVMGHGVTEDEAFANRLEDLLVERATGFSSVQVINAGVQGYATSQYLEVVRRSERLEPDGIIVSFCMNDVVEPLRVRKEHGGTGFDYHHILEEASWWRGYLVNQTGFGRWALERRFTRADIRRGRRYFTVKRMALSIATDSVFKKAWDEAMADLTALQELVDERGIPLLLVVFPTRSQVGDQELQVPQRWLAAHAQEKRIQTLDLTPSFEKMAVQEGRSWRRVFLDDVHLSQLGHRKVAEILLERFVETGSVELAPQ